ncbi:MAG: LysR family transcriptional regulator [Caldimonas sp.]
MHFRSLDLNLLRVFDVVMAERHVTRAAERLAMTQPAVSNAMRRLREAVGEELFVPGPAGVTPTRHAEALWPTVHASLQELSALIEPAGFDPGRDSRDFAIAMADATATVLMPTLVEDWRRLGVVSPLKLVGLDSRDPRSMLEHGHADLAVGFFPEVARELAGDAGFGTARLEALYDDTYVAVMRHDHPLASHAALSLDNYCDARHLRVDFAGRPRGYVDEALARLGRERRVVVTVEQFSTAGAIVSRSDLVAVLPRSFVPATGFAAVLACRALPFALPPICVSLLWHRRHEHDPAQRWLRDAVIRAAARVATALPGDAAVQPRLASTRSTISPD